ncbi:MAG: DUF4976 domain-containing protein, partial [Planctomycetes bacterium]|nr:DUF4976 domain-containing protein [Planctomycetota bacterium]
GEHEYQDKRWMDEESQRMPFLIRYPTAIPQGKRTDAIIENVDFAPTMLDFAGVHTPDYMQGKSFRSIASTGREPQGWKQAAYYRYWMHMVHHWNPSHLGIRTKRHKLIFYYGCDMSGGNRTPPGWELYDLEKDPDEVHNVYDAPAYASFVYRLKQQLTELRHRVGDTDEEFPEVRRIIDEFWQYDDEARRKAESISRDYAQRENARLEPKRASKDHKKALLLPGGYIQTAQSKAPLTVYGESANQVP